MTFEEEYERGFVDGMQHQMKSSVDRAVNAATKKEWVGLTDDDINDLWRTAMWNTEGTRLPIPEFARAIEAKLKEKNS